MGLRNGDKGKRATTRRELIPPEGGGMKSARKFMKEKTQKGANEPAAKLQSHRNAL